MTLDDAIEHAKEVARTCDDPECAADHMQLAEWLRTARGAEKAARWYTARMRELEEACDEYADLMHEMSRKSSVRRYVRFLDENSRLIAENESLQTENAKLRELCKRFAEYVSQDNCEGCVC